LDIKALTASQQFRLRVGGYRVIYSKNDEIKIIHIEKIKPRGGAYK
jgi:mRNA interferase RelE/StbE